MTWIESLFSFPDEVQIWVLIVGCGYGLALELGEFRLSNCPMRLEKLMMLGVFPEALRRRGNWSCASLCSRGHTGRFSAGLEGKQLGHDEGKTDLGQRLLPQQNKSMVVSFLDEGD
jgi:hypothetical protein